MYQVAKEYRSSARLNLLLLFWDMWMFWKNKSEIDSRCSALFETKPGLIGWVLDARFKYKRWQTRDVPPADVKDKQVEVAALLEQLEGSTASNIGLPGRVHDQGTVEWHANVTALPSRMFLRHELAIKFVPRPGQSSLPVHCDSHTHLNARTHTHKQNVHLARSGRPHYVLISEHLSICS